MAKKFNQKLLNEELKKFRMLSEYSFYTEEPKKRDDDDLILGSNLEEADEDPNAAQDTPEAGDDSKTAANAQDDASAESGTDTGTQDDTEGGEDANMFDTGDDTTDTGTDAGTDTGMDTGVQDDAMAGGEEEVDIDVTQLVKGSEEAKKSADLSFIKTTELLSKFNDLEKRVAAMDSISTKISNLEKEIVKRNPTPVEKLEMRSMDSFPYNIKLTDYWKDVEGYDPTEESKPKEYVLTKDEVDGAFDPSIKSTFNVPEDYEEEDIQA